MDDKQRAEGIAATDYSDLFVEKGTVIHATRKCKSFEFKEILEKHKIINVDRFVSPSPEVGGWTKFVKDNIACQRRREYTRAFSHCEDNKEKQQSKKGGRGWLHR